MREPDPSLVAAAGRGDLDAFETLVRTYQVDVWRLCMHLLGDTGAAEDAAQETFVRAFRFISRYKGDSRFSAWLLSIARNCSRDELRKLQRRRKLDRQVESQPRDRPPGPAELETRELLAELSAELREPIVLIDVFGVSYREAAEMLGVREGTVKSRVHRGREQLARAYMRAWEAGADEG